MTDSRNSGRYLAPALVACAVATAAAAAELTIDRLFDAPPLAGPTIVGLKISPDGSRVTYLRAKQMTRTVSISGNTTFTMDARVLVDSKALAPKQEKLSDEEIERRERQRTAALSGILEYTFAPSGCRAFSLEWQAVLLPTRQEAKAVVEIIHSHGFASDATISPAGGESPTFAIRISTSMTSRQGEKALTSDGGGAIKNGMAEFVAQEEMDRSTGYWWAPDGRHIAFARVDESPIKVTERFEISADNVATFAQRYPTTGGPNVLIKLGVIDIKTRRGDLDGFGQRPRYLSCPRQLAARWQDSVDSAREPQSAKTGPAVCGHRHRQDAHRSHRNQQYLD